LDREEEDVLEKILSPAELQPSVPSYALRVRVSSLRRRFDLLHVGHVRYLAAAHALGDALVVAINSESNSAAS